MPLLFILFFADLGNNLENKIISYADDITFYFEISTFSDFVKFADSLSRDLLRIQMALYVSVLRLLVMMIQSLVLFMHASYLVLSTADLFGALNLVVI